MKKILILFLLSFLITNYTQSQITVTLDLPYNCYAFSISASANPSNGGTVNGDGNFYSDQTATLTAIEEVGYDFVNWTEDGVEVSLEPTYSFTVNENRILFANFEIQTFDVLAGIYPENSGYIEGNGVYEYGQTAELTATPETGYEFVNWTEDSEEVSTESFYTFEVFENTDLTANFTQTINIKNISNNEINVFPVPGCNYVNIQSESINSNDDLKLRLVNSFGQEVEITYNVLINNTVRLDLNKLSSGLYFLHILQKDKVTYSVKIIISK